MNALKITMTLKKYILFSSMDNDIGGDGP